MDPQHAETLHALDGLVHGKVEPVMAARVLEPIYETGGEYAKLVDVLEVMVAHNEDPLARVELLHRIAHAARADDRQRARGVRRLRARAARRLGQPAHARPHRAARGDQRRAWEALAKLYQAESEQVARRAAPGRSAARASRASTSRSSPTSRRRSRRYRRILEVEFDNKPAVLALDRLYTHDGRVAGAHRRSCAARSSSPRATTEIADAAVPPRSDPARTSSVIARAPSRCTARSSPTTRRTSRRSAALENMFHAGHLQLEIGAVARAAVRGGERVRQAARHPRGPARPSSSGAGSAGDVPAPRRARRAQALRSAQGTRLVERCASSRIRAGTTRSRRAERLAGATGAWDDMVTAYTRALERTTDTRRPAALTLLRLARVYEFELARRRATRSRRTSACSRSRPKDADALAALDRLYLDAGMYDDLAEILRRRIEVVAGPRRAARAVLPPRRDLQRRARRPRPGARVLHGGPRAGEPQPARARGDRGIHFRREDVAEAVRDLREADRHRRGRRGDGRHLRAHGAHLLGRAQRTRTRRSSCSVACSTSVARSRRRCRPSPTCTSAASSGKSSSRSSSARSRSRPRCGADSALQAPRSRVGREARSRAQRTRRVARRRSHRRQRPRDAALAGAALPVHAGVGRAVADAPPHHRRRSAVGRDRRERDDRAVRTARSARG